MIMEVLKNIDTLPPMPDVALKLLKAVGDPDVDMGAVADWISSDASMTANLLKLCNSSFYGFSQEISSVKQAANLMGLRTVAQLAITVLASRYLSGTQEGYGLENGELWKHSIIAGTSAEAIAAKCNYADVGTAYTAGLLQDVGKIIISQFVGEKLDEIKDMVDEESISFSDAEKKVLGLNHSEVGAMLLKRWNFPEKLIEAILYHHNSDLAKIDPDLCRIAQVADAVTMSMGIGLGSDGMCYLLPEEVTSGLNIRDPQFLDEVIATVAEKLKDAPEILTPPS